MLSSSAGLPSGLAESDCWKAAVLLQAFSASGSCDSLGFLSLNSTGTIQSETRPVTPQH